MCARETSGGKLIPQIDGLRFFAIGAVLLFHTNGYVAERITKAGGEGGEPLGRLSGSLLHTLLSQGFFGVHLFFAISGFILAMPFASHYLAGTAKPGIGKYFVRRVTRLEPPYIINLLAMWALFVATASGAIGDSLRHLLASIFYCHNAVYGGPSTISIVVWSLEIEVQFYILAPLLATVFAVRPAWLRRGVIAGAMLAIGAAQDWSPHSIRHGLSILDAAHFFLCGFLLVDLYLVSWKAPARRPLLWDALSLIGAAGMIAALVGWSGDGTVGHDWRPHVVLPWCIVALYAGALRGRLLNAFVSNAWVFTFGGMCYTCYLWHLPVIFAAGYAVRRLVPRFNAHELNFAVAAPVALAAVVAATAVLFVLFEKPFMRKDWPQRVWQRLTRRAATPAGVAGAPSSKAEVLRPVVVKGVSVPSLSQSQDAAPRG